MSAQAQGQRREILVVDDDALFRRALVRQLDFSGVLPHEASDLSLAVEKLKAHPRIEGAIVDLRMETCSGLDVIRTLRSVTPELRTVIFSGFCSSVVAVEAMKLGAVNCLPKSTPIDLLLADVLGAPTPTSLAPVPTLAQVEWEHIQRVLHAYGGNVSRAARALGLHRQSLQRKLKRFAPR